jgi:ABC-type lipoprotein export system ATPase subunit
MFDVPPDERQKLEWHGDVPLDDREWNVGLIVGPSGSGKTTIARELFGAESLAPKLKWSNKSVLDDFPKTITLQEIADICMAVGFNTIPAWMRRYDVLSNGEQFRVTLARLLAESPELVVLDEFTSVVDRQVAKIGSHAVQKYVRKRGTKFVAVSCHADVIDWLNPDWVLEPTSMSFTWRELRRRPSIECDIAKVPYETWGLFAPYHYLTRELHRAAQCYCLFVDGAPAAFVCRQFTCQQPVTQPAELRALLLA